MFKINCILIIVGLALSMPLLSFSQDDTSSVNLDSLQFNATEKAENYSINLLKVASRAFVSLIIIVLLIFVTIYLLRKVVYSNKRNRFLDNTVNVIGMVPLSAKKSIYLIKIINQILVVGVTENNISLLSEINDLAVINKLESDTSVVKNHKLSFKNYLEKMLGKENVE